MSYKFTGKVSSTSEYADSPDNGVFTVSDETYARIPEIFEVMRDYGLDRVERMWVTEDELFTETLGEDENGNPIEQEPFEPEYRIEPFRLTLCGDNTTCFVAQFKHSNDEFFSEWFTLEQGVYSPDVEGVPA